MLWTANSRYPLFSLAAYSEVSYFNDNQREPTTVHLEGGEEAEPAEHVPAVGRQGVVDAACFCLEEFPAAEATGERRALGCLPRELFYGLAC